jgi:hypothetical protein
MIALGLDSAKELAEAIYLAEITASALAIGIPPHGNAWLDLDPDLRAIKIAAARRLIKTYRVEGMGLI